MDNDQLNNNQFFSQSSNPGASASTSSSPSWWQNWHWKIIRGIVGLLFSGEVFINLFWSLLTTRLNEIFASDTLLGMLLGALLIFRQYILLVMSCSFLIIIILWWQPVTQWGKSATQRQKAATQKRGHWWPKNEDWRLLFIVSLLLVICILVNTIWISPETISVSFTPATKNASISTIEASEDASSGNPSSIVPINLYSLSKQFIPGSATARDENCLATITIIRTVKIYCHTSVSQGDVDTAVKTMQTNLEATMLPQLEQQTGRTLVSGVNFTQIASSSIKPSVNVGDVVNSSDKKFTVTIAQMQTGTVEYVDNSDVKKVVVNQLNTQANSQNKGGCPGGYEILPYTLKMSSPMVPSADLSQPVVNELTLQVTASAKYFCSFPLDQVQGMQNNLVGKSRSDAQKYLVSQGGQGQSINFFPDDGPYLPLDAAHIHIQVNSPPQT